MNITNPMSLDSVWDLEGARMFIGKHQAQVMQLGFYIALGGGVLNAGHSRFDMDLVVVPRWPESQHAKVMSYFETLLGTPEPPCALPGGVHCTYFKESIEILYVNV